MDRASPSLTITLGEMMLAIDACDNVSRSLLVSEKKFSENVYTMLIRLIGARLSTVSFRVGDCKTKAAVSSPPKKGAA
jgi:hypothetical protein